MSQTRSLSKNMDNLVASHDPWIADDRKCMPLLKQCKAHRCVAVRSGKILMAEAGCKPALALLFEFLTQTERTNLKKRRQCDNSIKIEDGHAVYKNSMVTTLLHRCCFLTATART